MLRLPSDTPLVGFHGKVNMLGMTSLGVILVDTLDPVCQKPLLDDSNMWMYQAMDDFTAASQTEGDISKQERARAQALEAILMDESLHNVHRTKEDIAEAIKALHQWAPINIKNGVPESLDDLKNLINQLEELDEDKEPLTNANLSLILDKIAQFYKDDDDTTSSFPINIGIFQ